MTNQIPDVYKQLNGKKILGIFLAFFTIISGMLLIGISGWFITITGLTGVGVLNIMNYNLFLPSAIIRFLAVGKPLLRYQERLFTHRVTLRQLRDSRIWVFKNIFRMKKQDLIHFRSNDLAGRIVTDVNEMDQLYLGIVIPWLSMSLSFIISTIIISLRLPQLLWVFITTYVLSGILIPLMAFKTGSKHEIVSIKVQHDLQNDIIEYLKGFLELKFFRRLDDYSKKLLMHAGSISRTRRISRTKLSYWTLLSNLTTQSALLAFVIIIYQKYSTFPNKAEIVFIVLAIITLFENLQTIPEMWYGMAKTLCAGNRLTDLVRHPDSDQNSIPFPSQHNITFSGVSFSYGDKKVLTEFDLIFKENTVTILKGANGAGKSTILDLICGLKLPDRGSVYIGNYPVDKINPAEIVHELAYMEQQVTLFNMSVYENIAFGKTGALADEVLSAAIKSGLIQDNGQSSTFLNSPVGEGGKNVSGGQARMIALARIILKNASIVLMDEPTEGLDDTSEQNFLKIIKSWQGEKTIIVVTHKETLHAVGDSHIDLSNPTNG